MKKIDSFVNYYPLSKTLRFSLIPVGKTEDNFNAKLLLEEDEKRAIEYEKVKRYIDRYHKHFIETVLANFHLDDVNEYAELYYKAGKDDKDLKYMEKLEGKMRKSISAAFTKDKKYKEIFGQEIIKNILPEFLENEDEKESVKMFQGFFTYFTGFNDNRKNMYTHEAQTTAISYRCINENLPKFLDNVQSFAKIKESISSDIMNKLDEVCMDLYGVYAQDMFCTDYFSFVLSQSGIDRYNNIIGGYVDDKGVKIQGINEYINLYNQQVDEKNKRLPLMKKLYKQILIEKESISFIPEKFESDNIVINAISDYYHNNVENLFDDFNKLFNEFSEYDDNGIFVTSGLAVTDISNAVFGSWNIISDSWNEEYKDSHPMKKTTNAEKYYEDMKKEYKKNLSFTIAELQRLGEAGCNDECKGDIKEYYKTTVAEKIENIKNAYEISKDLLASDYEKSNDKKLCKNDSAISLLKNLLDSIKDLEKTIKPLLGTGKEENKDDVFYGKFTNLYEMISEIDRLYDKVRNYVTQKPYSKDKIKLNFENPQHLGGWDKNKERDYRSVLLKKEDKYYLAIMDKSNNKAFIDFPDDGECYEKIEYKLLPGPNKMLPKVFFASSNIEYFAPSKKILEIRSRESFKKGDMFNLKDCHEFIDFFKESIKKHEDWSQFGFEFSPTEKYNDISEFYNEVKIQGYSLKYKNVSKKYIDELIECGQLYLFQIYNKDFSVYAKGNPNLHTMYFKMLFDERNLANVVYQLNGGAEMFYRKASIKDSEKIVHHANQPIKNKNADNVKKESVFEYDIIKDKRFTKRQFSIHIPITLNFKAKGQNFINNDVRMALKKADENYVIGIDRGERNLLYICVINSKGEIVEQKSLNEIIGDNGYRVDYHKLLDKKEAERDEARKSWGTIENIKELKEGYLSQIVHEISKLVIKYDAVIAIEDLNSGFKKGRFKVEKQVYQKFENMLCTKLNYLVDKNADANECGGLLKAYQLTNKEDGANRGRQNGIIFSVPAWLTSKIDPVTGFADLLRPKYKSVSESVEFISKIDNIRYNSKEDYFEFDIDYSKFPNSTASYKKKWTVCTYGERIINVRNKEKNNMWDNKTIVLTDEFKKLFADFGVDVSKNIKESVLAIDSKDFYYRFINLLANTLQLRNSEVGNVDVDYLISPVKGVDGSFYDSRLVKEKTLPENADANGAYNIARKALWAIDVLKQTKDEELKNANLSIKNAEWLEYVQK